MEIDAGYLPQVLRGLRCRGSASAEWLRSRWRRILLNRAVREMRRLPAGVQPPQRLLRLLHRGWGNDKWTPDVPFLSRICEAVLSSGGDILECGSGLSTLLLALFTEKNGGKVYSLEHHPEWRDQVTALLDEFGLDCHLYCSLLRSYGDYVWYELPACLPRDFSLVVCDGPPKFTPGGRYGLMPVCGDRIGNATILLHDAHRPQEREAVRQWGQKFNVTAEYVRTVFDHEYAIIRAHSTDVQDSRDNTAV
jgi:hypothetical protein